MKKPTRKTKALVTTPKSAPQESEQAATKRLLGDIRLLIEQSLSHIAQSVNSTLVMRNWRIGKRIRDEILRGKRADYGEKIVHSVSAQLSAEYGRGYGKRNLFNMIRFAEVFPDQNIVSALSLELSWTHLRLLELGSDFAFLARQKRISVDEDDFYLDLLFYHRRLRRLVAVDLKIGRFKPADAGQMHLYLAWLDRYERQPGEEAPLGLILCAEKSVNRIELLKLGEGGIRVAEYLTELPPREILAAKLNQAIRLAREKMAMKQVEKAEAEGSDKEEQ